MATLRIALLPPYPVTAGEFTLSIAGLTYEVYDMNVVDLENNPTNLASSVSVPQDSTQAVAYLVITLGTGGDEFITRDLRIKVYRGTDLIVDAILNYNFVTDTSKPGGYLVIPLIGFNLQSIFRKNGLPPRFSDLEDAVNAVLDADEGNLDIIELNLKQCRHVARELVWSTQENEPPKPDKKLWKLFTLDTQDDDLDDGKEQARQKFERELDAFYNTPDAKAENLAKYIWALRCAYKCVDHIASVNEIQFRFPLFPDLALSRKTREIELKITGGFGANLDIPVEYFYALGVELPVSMDWDFRYNSAISTEDSVLLEQFAQALEKGIIDAGLAINNFQAYRRLYILKTTLSSGLSAPLNDNAVYVNCQPEALLFPPSGWLAYTAADLNIFWDTLSFDQEHADLVLFALVQGNQYLYNAIHPLATSVNALAGTSQQQWEARYVAADAARIAFDNTHLDPDFLPKGKVEEQAKAFALYAMRFFNTVAAATLTPVIINQMPVPSFGVEGPVESFLATYTLGSGFDPVAAMATAAGIIKDDVCGQQWLVDKIAILDALFLLTKDLKVGSDPIPVFQQYPVMEALYARGFTSAVQIADLSETDFIAALTGTVAYPFGKKIHEASGVSSMMMRLVNGASRCYDSRDTVPALLKAGYTDAGSIVAAGQADLSTVLTGAGASDCTEAIYRNAQDQVNRSLAPLAKACDAAQQEAAIVALVAKKYYDPGSIVASGSLIAFDKSIKDANIRTCLPGIYEAAQNLVQEQLANLVRCDFDSNQVNQMVNLLIAQGFTDAGSIAAVSKSVFLRLFPINDQSFFTKDCLVFIHQAAIAAARTDLALLTKDCNASAQTNPQAILAALIKQGFKQPQDICQLSFKAFLEKLQKGIALECAKHIYQAAGGNPDNPDVPGCGGVFHPVNDGCLVNCIPPAHLAPTGPTAYLHDLLLASPGSTCAKPAGPGSETLGNIITPRRGDLGALKATSSNAETPIPLIDLANEQLENMVATGSPQGAVYDTAYDMAGGHFLSRLDGTCADEKENDGVRHDPAVLLQAMPEHSSPVVKHSSSAYDKLKNDFSDACHLPYDQALDVSRSYLQRLGLDRFEAMRRFGTAIRAFGPEPGVAPDKFQKQVWRLPLDKSLAYEYLCFSQEEYDFLFGQDLSTATINGMPACYSLFGFIPQEWKGKSTEEADEEWLTKASNLCTFLESTCLSYCEFHALTESGFMPLVSDQADHLFPKCEPCCCNDYQLEKVMKGGSTSTLTKEDFVRLMIFIRLWRKMQCVPGGKYTFAEFRDICEVLELYKNGAINPDFLYELAHFQLLRDIYHLPLTDGSEATGTGATHTHLLALWAGAPTGQLEWAIDTLLDAIQIKIQKTHHCERRPPEFVKILKNNLNALSELAGFSTTEQGLTWIGAPHLTAAFAEVLGNVFHSRFSVGELFFLFSKEPHLAGDDPFPLPSGNEALENPLELPDDDGQFSLWQLRAKLLSAAPDSSEWTWMKINAVLRDEFGYTTAPANDPLQSLGYHFFPNTLVSEGYLVNTADRQYRTHLTTTVEMLWNEQKSPFRYDLGNKQLWTELPWLTDEAVIAKLSRVRQLTTEEIKAVQHLYFMPRADMARFRYVFSNFTEAQEMLLQQPDEEKRWVYFRDNFALFYERCQIVAQHLADHVTSATSQACGDSKALAWEILKNLYADENLGQTTWQDSGGAAPDVKWPNQPSGGAFSAMVQLTGTGLLGAVKDKKGNLIWREVRGGLDAFGGEENNADSPFPTVLPGIEWNATQKIATIRNGFALENQNGKLLGGAEGYSILWEGLLLVETSGNYTFWAGAPTPGNEVPDFKKASKAQWSLTLQRGHKQMLLLSHDISGESAPPHCSAPVLLKEGVYEITIQYIQPEPSLDNWEDGCPQTTGFQVKYSGADTDGAICTLPIERLYVKSKSASLGDGITEVSDAANNFLSQQYVGTMRDFLRTYSRAFASMLFAHRFELSANRIADDGMSEIGYLLSKPSRFAGLAFSKISGSWVIHLADFNFNLLPVVNNYYPPESSTDKRADPDLIRQQALFDVFLRIYDYTVLRHETRAATENPVWLALKESAEGHADHEGHLLRHMGIDLRHTHLVTNFFGPYTVLSSDLEDERWTRRVWEAEKGLRRLLCAFFPADITQARPLLWAAPDPNAIYTLEIPFGDQTPQTGNGNLTRFVRFGLIENGIPRRYDELKQLNDGLRVRAQKALLAYLTRMNRITLPEGGFATTANDLNGLLLMDVVPGLCQAATRIEASISAVQTLVQRARLGLEPTLTVSSEFRRFWDKRMAQFHIWEKSERQDIYRENFIAHEKTAEARKSESFQMLEDRLRTQTLSVPVSGGVTILSTQKPPAHTGMSLLQKKAPSTTQAISDIEGFDLFGKPENYTRPGWLADIREEKLPFWLEAAIQMKVPFVRVAAAGIPPAGITYDCADGICCSACGDIHPPLVDEYYFWMITGKYYAKITQDASREWDNEEDLPKLLHLNTRDKVYLAWTHKHNGVFQPMRWSFEGVTVTGTPGLNWFGRFEDSLHFEITGADTLVGIPACDGGTPFPTGFRYDMVTDTAVPVRAIGLENCFKVELLTPSTYFAYFDPGAPLVPNTMFAPALAVAQNLEIHCKYEEAVQWYELVIKPLKEDNRWQKCVDNQSCCCESGEISEQEFCRRAMLLYYLETLIRWGKNLLQKNTGASIQQARLILETAGKILGECPLTTQAKWQDSDDTPKILDFIPMTAALNPQLICKYEEVADGLALVHHCMNNNRLQNGRDRDNKNYWQTTVMQGSCREEDAECCDDLWCMPTSPYRFTFLISKAMELAGTVSSLGNSLSAAFKEGDAEFLAALRESQSRQLLEQTTSVRELNARESNWQTQALEKTLEITQARLAYYQLLVANGLIAEEEDYKAFIDQSMIASATAQGIEAITAPIHLTPDAYAGPFPLLHATGGDKIAQFVLTGAKIAHTISSIQGTRASKRLTTGGWTRRLQEWNFQIQTLEIEVEQVKRQLLAAQLREKNALRDLNNHQIQLSHAIETHHYMRDKFTSQQLYLWMQKELAAMHYHLFECALQTARQAERAYNRERGYTNEHFLNMPFWDSLHEGLLSGERLQKALRCMEKSYLDNNVRRYELTKHISMRHFFPAALLQLIATGTCEIQIPEALFDLDNPGHYLRMLKSVSISIPCIVGPYATVNCRLTLLNSQTRITPKLHCGHGTCCTSCHPSEGYYSNTADDNRFAHEFIGTQSIATSTGQNDPGIFNLDFRDERNLPFEHYGAISTWRIELPKEQNYFDMHTISDAVLHFSLTAKEGGELLRKTAIENAKGYLPGNSMRLITVKNDKPDLWFQMESSHWEKLPLIFSRNDFPYLPFQHDMSVVRIDVFIEMDGCEPCDHLNLFFKGPDDCVDCDDMPVTCVRREDSGRLYHGVFATDFGPLGISQVYGSLVFPKTTGEIKQVYLLCTYEVERKECKGAKNCGCGS